MTKTFCSKEIRKKSRPDLPGWCRHDARPDAHRDFCMNEEAHESCHFLVVEMGIKADCDKCKNKVTCIMKPESDVIFEPQDYNFSKTIS